MGSDNSKGYMLHATLRRTCTTRRTTKNKEAQLIFRSLSHDPGSSLAVVFWLKAIFCPRLADIWHDDKFPLIIGGRDCIKDAWFVKVIIPTTFPSRQLSTRRVFTSGISRPSEVLLPGHPRAAVMEEIIQGMERALPEPSWEEIDHWLNCHNEAATLPAWYERAEEFTSIHRY